MSESTPLHEEWNAMVDRNSNFTKPSLIIYTSPTVDVPTLWIFTKYVHTTLKEQIHWGDLVDHRQFQEAMDKVLSDKGADILVACDICNRKIADDTSIHCKSMTLHCEPCDTRTDVCEACIAKFRDGPTKPLCCQKEKNAFGQDFIGHTQLFELYKSHYPVMYYLEYEERENGYGEYEEIYTLVVFNDGKEVMRKDFTDEIEDLNLRAHAKP